MITIFSLGTKLQLFILGSYWRSTWSLRRKRRLVPESKSLFIQGQVDDDGKTLFLGGFCRDSITRGFASWTSYSGMRGCAQSPRCSRNHACVRWYESARVIVCVCNRAHLRARDDSNHAFASSVGKVVFKWISGQWGSTLFPYENVIKSVKSLWNKD